MMENTENYQHAQLPNKMAEDNLTPKDQLVYVVLRSFMNEKTLSCFPSLTTIAELLNVSVPTISKSIKVLKTKNYISITKEGRKNVYHFKKLTSFEPFSKEFLERSDISPNTKAYIVATQQYMFKDIEGVGKVSYTNKQLAEKINLPERTIKRCDSELKKKDFLMTANNKTRLAELGYTNTETKIFDMSKLGQDIIWTLQNHEERLTDVEQRVKALEEANKEKDKLITKLKEELYSNKTKTEFTL